MNKYSHAEGAQNSAFGNCSHVDGWNSIARAMSEASISTQQAIDAFCNLFGNIPIVEKQEEINTLKEVKEYVAKQEEKEEDLFERFHIEHLEMKNLLEDSTEPQPAAQPQSKTSSSTCTVKTRLCMRYDTEENWRTNPGFIPLRGEVCIVEAADSDWGYHPRKIIIGNGTSTLLNMLENGHYMIC